MLLEIVAVIAEVVVAADVLYQRNRNAIKGHKLDIGRKYESDTIITDIKNNKYSLLRKQA